MKIDSGARAFEVLETDSESTYRLKVDRPTGLMGIECPSCDAWATFGIEYPSVDPFILESIVPAKHLLSNHSPELMSIETFNQVKDKLAPILGPDRPVIPGIGVGPLRGIGHGDFPDIICIANSTLLAREHVFQEMIDEGHRLIGIPVEFKFRHEPHERYIEFEVRPSVRVQGSPSPLKICCTCGQVLNYHGKDIDSSTFDPSIPLQRILDWPTRVLANERFTRFVKDRSLSGIKFAEIELPE